MKIKRIVLATMMILVGIVVLLGQSSLKQTVSAKKRVSVYSKLVITTPDVLPGVVVGNTYSVQFAATGGKAPYTWSMAACDKFGADGITTTPCSSLTPGGLTMTPGGLLSGTATEAGNFQLTVQAQDSAL